MITKSTLYCPGADAQFIKWCWYFLDNFPDFHPEPLFGGLKELGDLTPKAKIFLFIHGHDSLPIFTNETGKSWTAAEMAAYIEKDGLNKDHLQLEMLVCNAGISLNTDTIAEQLKQLQAEYKEAQKNGDEKKVKKITLAFQILEENSKPSKEWEKGQILPLAAEFVKELSALGYTKLTITCYQAPIVVSFRRSTLFLEVRDEFGSKDMVSTTSDEGSKLKVIWRAVET